MTIEFVITIFFQLALVSYVNFKAYYFLKNRVLYTAWLGPLVMAVVYLWLIVAAIREGTEGSWMRLFLILFYGLLVLSSLAAIAAGYLDRRKNTSPS